MSLDNAAENCRLPDYPESIKHPAAVNYMESIGAVVACGGENLADASKCFAYDGSSWTPLPASTQKHCSYDSPNLMVDQGWLLTGRLQTDDGICSSVWTSEIFTGKEWIPQHPAGHSSYSCLVKLNSSKSMYTGGDPTYSESWIYDWDLQQWEEAPVLNEGRDKHGCAVLEGQGVLVAGGLNGDNIYSVELFDPATGVWTRQPSLPGRGSPRNFVLEKYKNFLFQK